MTSKKFTALLFAGTIAFVGGCDAFDYYPTRDQSVTRSDVVKDAAPGWYAGTNSSYTGVRPGSPESVKQTSATPGGPSINLGSDRPQTDQTASYAGSNVGGSTTGEKAGTAGQPSQNIVPSGQTSPSR